MTASSSPSTPRRPTGRSSRRTSTSLSPPRCRRTASSSPTPPRPGRKSTPRSPTGRSPPTSPARSTARAKCSRRRSCIAGCKAAGGDKLYLAKAEGEDDKDKKKAADKACAKVRKDGAAVDIDGDYTETLARLHVQPAGRRRVRPVVLREQHRQAEGRHGQRRRRRRSRPSPPASTRCRVRCSST